MARSHDMSHGSHDTSQVRCVISRSEKSESSKSSAVVTVVSMECEVAARKVIMDQVID